MTRDFTGNQSFTGHRPAPANGLDRQLSGANTAVLAESPATANLVMVGGPNDGVVIPIPKDGLTLGRLPDNDIVIDDPWVSRRHAEIVATHDSYALRDLASSNGTFLTDRLIDASDYGLQDGDHIRLGRSDVQLVFRFSGTPTLKLAPRADVEGGQSPDGPEASRQARQAIKQYYPEPPASGPDTTGPDGDTIRDERESDEELVEGEIRLNVEAGGDVRLMFHFVHELRQRPEFTVLRMSGGPTQNMAVWLCLSERIPLGPLLSLVKFVSEVSRRAEPPSGGRAAEKVYNICLAI